MRKDLENLCNDFNNAGHLLTVISRSAVEQSAYLDVTLLKSYHQETAYALDFVADALKTKCEVLWTLLEDIPEEEERKQVII